MQPSFLPDPAQLSRIMSEAMAPAFVLGAVAGFVSILLGRLTAVVDRIRSLNEVDDDDPSRAHLKSDLPRLRRRAELLSNAAHLAILSGMCVGLLLIVGFICAFLRPRRGAMTAYAASAMRSPVRKARNSRRARCTRLFSVPMAQPVAPAASSYDCSCNT